MFLSQLKVLHVLVSGAVQFRRLEQLVGKDGGNEWKSWPKSKIGIHRIYLSDEWRSAKHILHSLIIHRGVRRGGLPPKLGNIVEQRYLSVFVLLMFRYFILSYRRRQTEKECSIKCF